MWRITPRGFTLQEVLILAAMNIATGNLTDRGMRARSVAEGIKEDACDLETS
jgi:hypothetical protein